MLSKRLLPVYKDNETTMQKAEEAMDLFIKMSSILVNTRILSRFGAVLANNGYCPFTDQKILQKNTAKAILPTLVLCGMNTVSGKFLRAYGLPIKTSITGSILVIIPQVGSLATFAPLLDNQEVSIKGRGVLNCVSDIYSNFNIFQVDNSKLNLTNPPYTRQLQKFQCAYQAVITGDFESLKKHIKDGLDVNGTSCHSRNLLHTAVIFNHLNILKYLLDLKLDVNFRDLYDHTPLDYSKYPEITSALESRGAVRSGKPIDFEINENQKLLDEEHQKLFWAAYFGDIDLMQFYLIHGCNIRQTSYDGKTILDVAIMRKNLAATKFIVNHWPQREELIPVVEDYMKKLTAPEYQPIKDYLEDACYEDDEF